MCSLNGYVASRTVTRRKAIRAYKVFRRVGHELRSIYGYHRWQNIYCPRVTFTAREYRLGQDGGFYCANTYAEAHRMKGEASWPAFTTVFVVKPVLIWGQVHEYKNGYRSQFLKLA